MEITVDESRCIGAGNCVMTASEVFDQREDDGIAVVLVRDPPPQHSAAVARARELCPAAAITVTGT